jgi:hypothetical protein
MIREIEQYHGVVLARLIRGSRDGSGELTVKSIGRSSYVVGGTIGLYVKRSTSRLTPWSFSFQREHQRELQSLSEECTAVFVVLVCGSDGIVCLSTAELDRVFDSEHQPVEWVKASRRKREKYVVTSSDDRRGVRVADSDFPARVLEALRTSASVSLSVSS